MSKNYGNSHHSSHDLPEKGWLKIVGLIARFSGLLHDVGKSQHNTQTVYQKSTGKTSTGADIEHASHEVVSTAIARAMITAADDGDRDLALPDIKTIETPLEWKSMSLKNNAVFFNMTCDIVATHHGVGHANSHEKMRFIVADRRRKKDAKGNLYSGTQSVDLSCFGLPYQEALTEIKHSLKTIGFPENRLHEAKEFFFYMSRMAMMMSDSAQSAFEENDDAQIRKFGKIVWPVVTSENPLKSDTFYAKSGRHIELQDHILSVAEMTRQATHLMFDYVYRRVEDVNIKDLPDDHTFFWQTAARKAIFANSIKREDGGIFFINGQMGCGKTRGSYGILSALSEDKPRFSLLLGFGSLAIQSGAEYRRDIGIPEHDCKTFVGQKFALAKWINDKNIPSSMLDFFFTQDDLGSITDLDIANLLFAHKKATASMIDVPIAVMTIDHIMSAMEANRGSFVGAALRLISGDILIDEIDSFGENDLHAIARLVFIAALAGRKVVISSATTPPEIAQMLFEMYAEGFRQHKVATASNSRFMAGIMSDSQAAGYANILEISEATNFMEVYKAFSTKILNGLLTKIHRRIEVLPWLPNFDEIKASKSLSKKELIKETKRAAYLEIFKDAVGQARPVSTRMQDGRNFSSVCVRFNKTKDAVNALLEMSKAWKQMTHSSDFEVRFQVLHGGMDSYSRQKIESKLTKLLNRKPQSKSWEEMVPGTKDVVFILLTTPIIEVGRDFDFDIAITEPCSEMSLIQLIGRVLRHRQYLIGDHTRVFMLAYTFSQIKNGIRPGAFGSKAPDMYGPGFEKAVLKKAFSLTEKEAKLSVEKLFLEDDTGALYPEGLHPGYRLSGNRQSLAGEFSSRTLDYIMNDPEFGTKHFLSTASPDDGIASVMRDGYFSTIGFRDQEFPKDEWIYDVVRLTWIRIDEASKTENAYDFKQPSLHFLEFMMFDTPNIRLAKPFNPPSVSLNRNGIENKFFHPLLGFFEHA